MKSKFDLLYESIMETKDPNKKFFKFYVIVPNQKIVFGSDDEAECQAKAKENPIWRVTLGSNLVYMGWDLNDPANWLDSGVESNEDHTVKYSEKDAEELMREYGQENPLGGGHFTND